MATKMWDEDRAAFINQLRETDREYVEEFTKILDNLLEWSEAFDWALYFIPRDTNTQKTVRFALHGMKAPFWTAYPQKTKPTKLSIIDTTHEPTFSKAIQDEARNALAKLDPDQDPESVQPRISFRALLSPGKLDQVKTILGTLVAKLSTRRPPEFLAPPPTPDASDIAAPLRIETTIYRILRDTEVARRVKKKHDYKCQICGDSIELPNGKRYAEAHHIHPLGSEEPGLDVEENILCVCPTHHAELDLAIWDIVIENLRTVPGHTVGLEHVRYHNEVIRKRWG